MLVRKSTPPPEPPPSSLEMPRSLDAVDAALLEIERERSAVQAGLASLPGREAALLDADADDAAFVALDIERKRSERALARLEIKETQLLRLAEGYHAEEQQRAYSAVRARYLGASQDLAAAATEVARRIEIVNTISAEAGQFMGSPLLPPAGYSPVATYMVFDGHLAVLQNQIAIAERTPAQLPRLPPRQRTVEVRFLKWTEIGLTAYQTGQIAGFAGAMAKRLVDGARAEYMARGMEYDAHTALFGAGPAPTKTLPPPVSGDE